MPSLGSKLVRGALTFSFAKQEVERFGARLTNEGMGVYKVHWPKNTPFKAKPAKTKSLAEAVSIAQGMAKDVAGPKSGDVY